MTEPRDAGLPPYPTLVLGPTGDAKITQPLGEVLGIQHIRMDIDNKTVALGATVDGFNSIDLGLLPDSNLLVLGIETNLTFLKGNASKGLITTTDLDVGLGTAAAGNTTLGATAVNILAKQDINTDALSVSLQLHTLAASFAGVGILDAPTNHLYLNVSASGGGVTSADSLVVDGEIDIFTVNLRNRTS